MSIIKVVFFIFIIIFSFYLISSYDIQILADQSLPVKILLSFASGLFYTSFLTTPLSVVLLIALAGVADIYLIVLFGGLGALIGDLIIVKIFRMIFHTFSFVKHAPYFKVLKQKLRSYHLDLVSFLLGVVIVASPFPDELGLALLGASKLSYFKLALIAFVANSLGILLILQATRAIL